uniref:Glycerol-3-phosphate dehydrogenase n=1 Tax=Romanomermis culicivorax TaxID=13658 RepID=A0A915KF14_ROMCU
MSWTRLLKRSTFGLGIVCASVGGGWLIYDTIVESQWRKRLLNIAKADDNLNVRPTAPLPLRSDILEALKSTPEFDVLIIGGGATGSGCAVDAQTRGLSTALVEADDYSSGTSSRSTKLIHGGVRYLQSAIMKFDVEQYRMVKEALFERANLLEIAPHISSALPIMLPIYQWWKVPYYWIGIKMYDLVSGKRILKSSYYINKQKALELFPMLKKDRLVGALIYYDGQQNDSRMNLALILTAIRKGAQCANHVSVVNLLKKTDESTGKSLVAGARVRDELTGKEWDIKAKSVINATGAFCDQIRAMDNPESQKLVVPSQGVHIVLPGYYSPSQTGLLDPNTSDGRVIFFLPWENMTVAGTTDSPCEITRHPAPAERDVEFILGEVRNYLSKDITVRRGDVLSAWAGLRPLVRDPSKTSTAALARNHIIVVSDSNLVTIAGGKWTTYRHMAEETVDKVIEISKLEPKSPCVTPGLLLEGAHDFSPLLYIRLVQDYGLEVDVARNLAHTYGDRAYSVAKLAKLTGKRWPIVGARLHEELPYLEAEVLYAVKEYASTAVDVIARRLRLAFLNTYAAEQALPKVIDIMAKELKWDAKEKKVGMQGLPKGYLYLPFPTEGHGSLTA